MRIANLVVRFCMLDGDPRTNNIKNGTVERLALLIITGSFVMQTSVDIEIVAHLQNWLTTNIP